MYLAVARVLREFLEKVLPSRFTRVIHPALQRRYPFILYTLEMPVFDGFFYIPTGRKIGIATNFKYKLWVQGESKTHLRDIFYSKVYERMFSVERSNVVIDVGANIGAFTIKAARQVGPTGKVVAIEPEAGNLALLRKNTRHLANVVVVEKAASSSKGQQKLYQAPKSFLFSTHQDYGLGHIKVEADTVDNIVSELGLDRVDFIKIDAEGAELEILEGATETLNSPGVRIAMEVGHYDSELDEVRRYLESRGIATWASPDSLFLYAKTPD